ncbi:MAG: hypothetical protein EWV45_12875 [Microcystis flos-aquae Mf_QC_C_20070823_S10D]|uniref:Uncharacterized protein n=1 Tax=Microcystis flos-aquae Mf_QC_C_20070823_S10D TaxID=2486236 RepID=A0A552KSA5_9CHRO|nr:MAG: hypothetical protein EWV65_03970 [Microcystis flos-aquae Ma_QC_C_20070823_S18D]TRV10854.1 MAG: hypothetical protein EWV45_12875 [Microcystis flos-aquae Mf_QC_C_20070823_S10D]TRV22107.1 MAG: hypothetical protein EWV72_15875 [Microcystis flos-aquae Mf_QC_C_20070823_S10]TRV32432.1 MAG: hypothetical protein EWV71_18220 [Microcystis flos-aquae Mf_QC_C_20070823_S20D]TRV34170.1 MAG: hypothetical protein EWV70_12240 [Microcystis flos-aquae Mf_QC_C_20070823_S20]TRV37184.1 MAG: hypothetical prot
MINSQVMNCFSPHPTPHTPHPTPCPHRKAFCCKPQVSRGILPIFPMIDNFLAIEPFHYGNSSL